MMKKEMILIACAISLYNTCAFSQLILEEGQVRYPLSKTINSPYIEARPLISLDGTSIYFCRRYYPENISGERDKQDIWYSKLLENGEWSIAKNLGEPINNKKVNALVSISPDGKEGIFINSYEKLGKQATKVLAKSYYQNEEWSEPESFTIYNYSNKGLFADFYFSYLDKVLLLAIQKKDDKELQGGQDLYVSIPDENGNFSEPINLGKIINTGKDEYAPFLGSDGKSLFFVSEGHTTMGGGDIFYSKRLDDSWKNWTVPENLGTPINSRNEETYFSVSSDFREIYFESYRKRALNRNIFKATLPEKFRPSGENIQPLAINELNTGKKTLQVPIPQIVNNTIETGKSEENPVESPEDNGDLVVTQSIEYPESENLSIGKNITTESANRFAIKSGLSEKLTAAFDDAIIVNTDKSVECQLTKNIYFAFNSSKIKEEYLPKLNKINQLLAEENDLVLQIEGYADAIGNQRINKQISDSRAKQVSRFLIEKGKIRPDKIVIQTYGEQNPMATNDDNREGRELNRRVSLKFILP